jgi:hypothetical protein
MSHCSEAGLNFRIIPVGINAPLEFLTGFTEGILLRRLIRSLKNRHSMVPGRLIQLRFKTLFKKKKSLFFFVIEKDSRESKSFLRVKAKDYVLYLHPVSSLRFVASRKCGCN